jgi:hypothetical protein
MDLEIGDLLPPSAQMPYQYLYGNTRKDKASATRCLVHEDRSPPAFAVNPGSAPASLLEKFYGKGNDDDGAFSEQGTSLPSSPPISVFLRMHSWDRTEISSPCT